MAFGNFNDSVRLELVRLLYADNCTDVLRILAFDGEITSSVLLRGEACKDSSANWSDEKDVEILSWFMGCGVGVHAETVLVDAVEANNIVIFLHRME